MRTLNRAGFYLYGVVPRTAAEVALRSQGVHDGGPVEFLVRGPVAAVVSLVPLQELAQERLEERLKAGQVHWVQEKALAHALVLQELMQRGPVVPVRFGILFRDRSRLLSALAAQEGPLTELLDRLAGKVEWGVQACCPEETLKEVLGREDPEVKGLQEPLPHLSPKAAPLRIGEPEKRLQERGRERLVRWAEQIHQALTGASESGQLLDSGGRRGWKETVVLLGAYLTRVEEAGRFREELNRLVMKYENQGLRFVLSGPWPPYHFAPVRLGEEALPI